MICLEEDITTDNGRIPLYYLCGYRSVSAGLNRISRSILKFKAGDPLHVDAWAEVAVQGLLRAGLDKGDIVVRALGHRETAVPWRPNPKPMDVLCRSVAERASCAYSPDLLRKKWKTHKLTGMSRSEWEEAMEGAYELAPVFGWGDKRIWIVDDVVTTGSTIRTIAAALRKRYASVDLRSFCLARTNGHIGDMERGLVQGESYGWDLRQGWVAMEEPWEYGDDWLPTIGNLSCPVFGNEGTWLIGKLRG